MKEFERLVTIMKRLRGENGCPWDQKQTIESLKPYLIEETYELLDAMDVGGEELKGELGDLLLNIVFQAQISEEKKEFNIEDVLKHLNEKLIRRHPHVFKDEDKDISVEKVLYNWEKIKQTEDIHKDRESILDGIPKQLPLLDKTEKILKKSSKYGFQRSGTDEILDILEENFTDLKNSIQNSKVSDELIGSMFFNMIDLARRLNKTSSNTLYKKIKDFERNLKEIENNSNIDQYNEEEKQNLFKNITKTK